MDFHVLYEQLWLSEQKAQEKKLLLNEGMWENNSNFFKT